MIGKTISHYKILEKLGEGDMKSERAASVLPSNSSRSTFRQKEAPSSTNRFHVTRLQGDGDYQGAVEFVEELGQMDARLQADLERVSKASIPVDVVFEQGL